MALLQLRDIGKIYVSEGNVAVGIRGVNLSFDRGEFVAITGRSGSGKSTLLNVISGMDTYEEGELLIEGQTTSHYLQPDWEAYREKYVSFIFQDYNIIDSYTVLQNVELALMHIDDKRERRRKAVELLTRVGMREHLHHKGSKLSGGQKQRTVIARALAKDSPIILADEPTGNLDHTTAGEIIALLREVSKDKLLLVVTHNFEEVEACATRHVRIFDGAVESDQKLLPVEEVLPAAPAAQSESAPKKAKSPARKHLSNGITLGLTMFSSRPKLSLFLSILLLLGTLGVFLVTALFGSGVNGMFAKQTMFNDIEGRLVLAHRDGTVLTEDELARLTKEYGAESYLHYDYLLDEGDRYVWFDEIEDIYCFTYVYGKDYGTPDIGNYPATDAEVFLYVPISLQPVYGEDTLRANTYTSDNRVYTVSGVKYFYDNNKTAEVLMTKDGFRTETAVFYLSQNANYGGERFTAEFILRNKETGAIIGSSTSNYRIVPSNTLEKDKIYLSNLEEMQKKAEANHCTLTVSMLYATSYTVWHRDWSTTGSYERTFTEEDLCATAPTDAATTVTSTSLELPTKDVAVAYVSVDIPDYALDTIWYTEVCAYIDAELYRQMAEETLQDTYRQASLFFETDDDAVRAAEDLQNKGYVAVPAMTEYEPDPLELILNVISSVIFAVLWALSILFLAFFVNLCSDRTLSAFKGDLAIMRSMGIQVKVIRLGMYVRTLTALLPAYLLTAVFAAVIYTNPKTNAMFTYLYGWQYAVIVAGMLLLSVRVTRRQLRKLFGVSVKKVLRGGESA